MVRSQPVAVRVIDAHCHAGIGDGLTGPWDTRAPLHAYLRRAAAAGIAHTVLIPVFTSDYALANQQVAAIAARDVARFSWLAMVHPGRDAGRAARMLDHSIRHLGAVGVKIHRHDAPVSREVCESVLRLQVALLYDVMGNIGHVELLAREFPALRLVIPHLGSFGDDWQAQLALLPILERHPNVYADTSGVRRFDIVLEAAQRVPHKLVFGSDGPWLHPGIELAKIHALGLSARQRIAITGRTAAQVFRLDRRRPPGVGTGQLRHLQPRRASPPTPFVLDPKDDPWSAQEVPPE